MNQVSTISGPPHFFANLDSGIRGLVDRDRNWGTGKIVRFSVYMDVETFGPNAPGPPVKERPSLSEYGTCYHGNNATYQSVLLHELGHALGMEHAQRHRFAQMRTNSTHMGYYCNGTGTPGRSNKSLTLPHPDDLAAYRHLYGNSHNTYSMGVMSYVMDVFGDASQAPPVAIQKICTGDRLVQPYAIANRGTEKMRYDRTLYRSANKEGTLNTSVLLRQYDRVKSSSAAYGAYDFQMNYPINAEDVPPVGEIHFGVMKLENIRRASDNLTPTLDRTDTLRTYFGQRYMRHQNCQ